MTKPTDRQECNRRIPPAIFEGRRCLIGRAVIAGGLAGSEARAGRYGQPPTQRARMDEDADPMGSQPYGTPSPFEKDVIKNISKTLPQYLSASGRTPLQDLDGIITPNGLFYERHHGGVPTIDPAQHRLMLHGLVDRPLIFTMDDVRRFPSESYIYFLECSGNPEYKKPYGKTASDRRFGELRRMERSQPEAGVAGSRLAAGRKMGRPRRRRCRGNDPKYSDREMPR